MTNPRNPKAKPNMMPSPETAPDASKPLLTPHTKPPREKDLERTEHALFRFGVRKEELAKSAQITPILDSALGKWRKAIDLLRFSADENAKQFLEIYDQPPKVDRDRVPIEAICIKAEVNPAAILGATLMAARQVSAQESALIAITEHPQVVKDTITFAGLAGGSKDRKMIHQAVGFLPTSKGVSMNVNLSGGNPQFGGAESGGDDDEDSFEQAFPSLNANLENWGNARRRLLEKGR